MRSVDVVNKVKITRVFTGCRDENRTRPKVDHAKTGLKGEIYGPKPAISSFVLLKLVEKANSTGKQRWQIAKN